MPIAFGADNAAEPTSTAARESRVSARVLAAAKSLTDEGNCLKRGARRGTWPKALAENAYDEMYDSRSPAGPYSNMKDLFIAAIGAARRAGLDGEAARLMKRLDQCREVWRKQFSSF